MTIEQHYRQMSDDFLDALYDTSACNNEVTVSLDGLVNFTEQARNEALELLNLIANAYLMGAEMNR